VAPWVELRKTDINFLNVLLGKPQPEKCSEAPATGALVNVKLPLSSKGFVAIVSHWPMGKIKLVEVNRW